MPSHPTCIDNGKVFDTTGRATVWSLTINNPTPSDEEGIALARQKGWKVEGQLEKGKDGTVHYQLMVKTPQVRFSAVKKAFPRAHIEVARNVQALQQYVSKQDTKIAPLSTSQEKYPSLSRYWELVTEWINDAYPYILCDDTPITLALLDKATYALIYEGYHVEGIATNPSTRSAWKQYGEAIMMRAIQETKDRQTSMRSNGEQSVVVPTTNNADEDERSEEGLSQVSRDASSQSEDYEDHSSQTYGRCSEGSDASFGEEDD